MRHRRQGLFGRDPSRSGTPRPSAPGWAFVESLEPRELLTLAVGSINVVEGTIFNGQVATFAAGDVTGTLQNFTAAITWGDGTPGSATVTPTGATTYAISGTHTYVKESIYPLSVVLNGTSGSTASALGTATVTDVAPVVTVAPFAPTALQSFSGHVASFTDAGPDLPGQYVVTINWGDATSSTGTVTAQAGSTTAFDVSGAHTYATAGRKTATVVVTNLAGTTVNGSGPIKVVDPLPNLIAPAFSPLAGLPFTGTVASFTDADPTLTPSSFAATIDWGDGSSTSAGTVASNGAGGFNVTGTHTYNKLGDSTTKITLFRLPDNVQTTSMGLAVVNSPVITPSAVQINASAGLPFKGIVATFTDTNPAAVAGDFTANIVWGDGQSSAGTVSLNTSGGFNVNGTNTYATSNKTYPVQVTITRTALNQNATVISSATVSDATLSPTKHDFSVNAGQTYSGLVATFTDGNSSATPGDYTATIDWGDGSIPTVGAVTFSLGAGAAGQTGFNVAGSHVYVQPGSELVHTTIVRNANNQVANVTSTATASASATLTGTGTTVTPVAGVPFTGIVASFVASPPASGGFVATIDWGDGQSTAGTIVPKGGGAFDVVGTHTYGATTASAIAGAATLPAGSAASAPTISVTPIKVLVVQPVTNLSKVIASQAVIVARPFSGGLDPLYDTGASNSDGITRINQPKFTGSAQPYSLVQLYSQGPRQSGPVLLGQAVANADGSWSVYAPGPLADGRYAITATVIPPSGSPIASVPLPTLTIDTVAPRVVGVVNDPASGLVTLVYRDDLSGIDLTGVVNPAFYTLIFGPISRRQAAFVGPQPTSSFLVPTDPQGAVVSLGLNPQQRRAVRRLRVLAAGVTDLAGNPLAGGDFSVNLNSPKGHHARPAALPRPPSHPKGKHPH